MIVAASQVAVSLGYIFLYAHRPYRPYRTVSLLDPTIRSDQALGLLLPPSRSCDVRIFLFRLLLLARFTLLSFAILIFHHASLQGKAPSS